MYIRFYLIAPLASLALVAHAQNLVKDPGFEGAAVNAYYASQTGATIDGGNWYVGEQPGGGTSYLAVVGSASYVISGTRSVQMERSSARQTLATVPGGLYQISFSAYNSNRGEGGLMPSALVVSLGAASSSVSLTATATRFTVFATATSASSLLSLGTREGATIDDVSVTAQTVPEPASMAALGIGALGLLRRRRK